jgi:hypothetical protein
MPARLADLQISRRQCRQGACWKVRRIQIDDADIGIGQNGRGGVVSLGIEGNNVAAVRDSKSTNKVLPCGRGGVVSLGIKGNNVAAVRDSKSSNKILPCLC